VQRKSAGGLSSKLTASERSLPSTLMCAGYESVRLLLLSDSPNALCYRLTDKKIVQFYSISIGDRWEHIYRCRKGDLKRKNGFAELYFQCDEWITNGTGWFKHCQRHLTDLETLLVQCNPLVFRRTLTNAGQCLFYLFDLKLSLTKRFHQFFIKQS